MRMHWSMRRGGDLGFLKGREEEMANDPSTYEEAGFFNYTGPVDFAEDRAWKEEKRNKELATALVGILALIYFF